MAHAALIDKYYFTRLSKIYNKERQISDLFFSSFDVLNEIIVVMFEKIQNMTRLSRKIASSTGLPMGPK
jgi:hypothetical protein